ncbi:hypothetical protein C8N46_104316 [Kordia periserrulae]|uniref:Lipoprotein n=1 Tax=Kordia periserrulae TaxID=701523 RepID=A0A2T6C026_9FLAO|nr:hypothetical protein [Kordia periserrulae]PTX61672.1 hypothetical protein C8N46_104316 [Kordia periserrulae]
MKRFSIVLVVIFSVLLSACNFMRKQVTADGSRNVTIQNTTHAIEYWLGSQPEADDKDSYHLYIKRDSLADFKRVVANMFQTEYDAATVQAVTIYTDTIFNEQDVTLAPTNISGVQIHFIEDSHLKTNVYKTAGDLQKIDALYSFVDYFSPKDVYDTSKIFKTDTNSVFIFVNADITSKYETGKSNYDKNLADYKLQNN